MAENRIRRVCVCIAGTRTDDGERAPLCTDAGPILLEILERVARVGSGAGPGRGARGPGVPAQSGTERQSLFSMLCIQPVTGFPMICDRVSCELCHCDSDTETHCHH